ncbi:hypothetical protein AB0M54_47320 [Actinoplanes sp. NPDC051470]|uniref:hypothetical protein n=1 Tax=unclassified Actinoplanes TaxID=2626549 RepID=UPI00344400E6
MLLADGLAEEQSRAAGVEQGTRVVKRSRAPSPSPVAACAVPGEELGPAGVDPGVGPGQQIGRGLGVNPRIMAVAFGRSSETSVLHPRYVWLLAESDVSARTTSTRGLRCPTTAVHPASRSGIPLVTAEHGGLAVVGPVPVSAPQWQCLRRQESPARC